MNPEILDFIKSQRVGVLAVEMLDGSPHAATVHFAHTDEPLAFFFSTHNNYRKAEPLLKNSLTRASFVIGIDESNMKTLQLDGQARVIRPDEQEKFNQVFFQKFPEKVKPAPNPNSVSFVFTPLWWRWTDWTKPAGKTIVSSTDKQ